MHENYKRFYAREKRALDRILPGELQTHTRAGRALMVATSFDTWRLLRPDEGLSEQDTEAGIKELVSNILKRIESA